MLAIPEAGILIPLVFLALLFNAVHEAMLSITNIVVM